MKILKWLINIGILSVVLFSLAAALGSAVTQKPVLLTVIRSNSMYPVWERGDLVLIQSVKEKDEVIPGDIAIFKAPEGKLASKGWIAHRIMEGNAKEGYITKGDANSYTDQDYGESPSINKEWVSGKAITINGKPIVIPLIGHLSLWIERFQTSPLLLPGIAGILAIVIGWEEMRSGNKKKGKQKGMDLQIIYILSGLTISVILGATMLLSSQHIKFSYEVSDKISENSAATLKVGGSVEQPLAELTNGGGLPLVAIVTTKDPQITTNIKETYVKKGEELKTTVRIQAKAPGKYESAVRVGLFYPLLPSALIHMLASQSYWLALTIISLIPGLPLILYPIINTKLRRKTKKQITNYFRKQRLMRWMVG